MRISDWSSDVCSSDLGVSATLDVDLGGANLQSITAYREAKSGDTLDIDSLPRNLVSFIAHTRQKQISEELQLSGKSGRREWIKIGNASCRERVWQYG